MEKYLLELLKEHNRVIIPNFGAFIVSQGKEKSIIFNGFLSFNDGLLISYISNKEGIDTVATTQKVDDFVKTINQSLETASVFEIENLGKFTKEDSGNTRFIQLGTTGSCEKEKQDAADIENSELLNISPVDSEDATVVNEQETNCSVIGTETLFTTKSLQTSINDITTEYTEKNIIKPAMEEIKEEPDNSSSHSDDNSNERKKPISIRLIIILLVVLILPALAYFLFWGNSPFNVFWDKTPPVDTIEQPVEEALQVVEEPEPVFEEPEPVVETAPAVTGTGTRHHIILGSFRDEWRASQLVDKLKEQGYAQANVFERNSRFLVSAESYSSVGKALERQEILLDKLKMESWVLTVR